MDKFNTNSILGNSAGKVWNKFQKFSPDEIGSLKECGRKTQDELRQLHAESLDLDPSASWEEIEQSTKKKLKEWGLPDTSCFFDLETWKNTCYEVPKLQDSCLDNEMKN